MKQGSLFCFVMLRSLKSWCFMLHSWYLWKALDKLLMGTGASTWFETLLAMVWKLLIIELFSQWQLNKNQNWKLHWNLGVFLMLLESFRRVRFNRVYFTTIRAKMWKIFIFGWILLMEIQTNLQKLGWKGKKISWALNVFTLGPTAQATLISIMF